MEDDKIETFICWCNFIYMGNIILKEALRPADRITRYLEFFILADKVDLRGPMTVVIQNPKKILIETKCKSQNDQHLGMSSSLRPEHEVRTMFAEACVGQYWTSVTENKIFNYQAAVDNYEGFAADLLAAVGRTYAKRNSDYGRVKVFIPLPTTGEIQARTSREKDT